MRSGPRITSVLVAATLACSGLRAVADEAPAPAPTALTPPVPVETKPGINLLANEPGLTYWLYDAGGRRDPNGASPTQPGTGIYISSFRMLCVVPCVTQLAPGTYTMGVSRMGNALITAPALQLRGDEVLTATYKSRWALRLGFFLGGLLTTATGAAVAFSGDPSGGRQALGAGILAVGVMGMVTPLFIQDSATITSDRALAAREPQRP